MSCPFLGLFGGHPALLDRALEPRCLSRFPPPQTITCGVMLDYDPYAPCGLYGSLANVVFNAPGLLTKAGTLVCGRSGNCFTGTPSITCVMHGPPGPLTPLNSLNPNSPTDQPSNPKPSIPNQRLWRASKAPKAGIPHGGVCGRLHAPLPRLGTTIQRELTQRKQKKIEIGGGRWKNKARNFGRS